MEEMGVRTLIRIINTIPFSKAHPTNGSLWYHHIREHDAAKLHIFAEVGPLNILVVELVDFRMEKLAAFQAEEQVNGPLGIREQDLGNIKDLEKYESDPGS